MDTLGCDPLLRPFAGNVLNRLSARLIEDWMERCAVVEYEAGVKPRALAEALALIELLCRNPGLLGGLSVLEIVLDGASEWLLTRDLVGARRYLVEIGAVEIAVLDPAAVVDAQYGGVARLSTCS